MVNSGRSCSNCDNSIIENESSDIRQWPDSVSVAAISQIMSRCLRLAAGLPGSARRAGIQSSQVGVALKFIVSFDSLDLGMCIVQGDAEVKQVRIAYRLTGLQLCFAGFGPYRLSQQIDSCLNCWIELSTVATCCLEIGRAHV